MAHCVPTREPGLAGGYANELVFREQCPKGTREAIMTGTDRRLVLRGYLRLASLLVLALIPGIAKAQTNPNERVAKPKINVQDKDDITKPESKIWVMEFKFFDPRLITVDIPGRGTRLCWYMKYQIINNSKEPHLFIPDFELVTTDKPHVYHDQVLPKVQQAIRQVEDPTGYQDIKNSVTITAKPIPPSPPGIPRAVTGVAIWDDVNPDANRFSIFVSGLSNGWSLAEDPSNPKKLIVRRKTLQLNFKRVGDRYYQRSDEIRFAPPVEWVYRATKVTVPASTPSAPAKKEGEKAAALDVGKPEKQALEK
jgi:hypothetical protein